jgi:hypothetical protein
MEMAGDSGSTEQDWRLQAELEVKDARGVLHDLIGRLREPEVVKDIEASVPHDVVITHDGRLLFAYAADEGTLKAARGVIEGVLRRDGIRASMRMSRWDDELDEWRQTDPPAAAQGERAPGSAAGEGAATETRTLVASTGRAIRAEFERTMLDWADKLGLECQIIEHPHLLTTQVAFTVTGPKRKIDEFSRGLGAEGRATIRTETGVLLSPL